MINMMSSLGQAQHERAARVVMVNADNREKCAFTAAIEEARKVFLAAGPKWLGKQ